VIVQYPCYQSLAEVANAIGCKVTFWKLEHGPNWRLDLNFLESRIESKTRLIIVNSPHNPTGYQFSVSDYKAVVDLARRKGIVLFSDEVYRFLEYDPSDRLPSLCELDDTGLSLGVMSKSFGLAGLRIGWIVTRNRELFHKLASYKDYTTICNSAPSEFLSIVALKNKQRILDRNLQLVRSNLTLLNDFFERYRHIFAWSAPKAGPIAFPGLTKGKVAEFCQTLVAETGVLLLPGTLYDSTYNNFRIGFGRATMSTALGKLDDYLVKQEMGP
jgi:aspartate/methionine/tyrosine aminotransferase